VEVSSHLHAPLILPPGKETPVSIEQTAEWAPESSECSGNKEKPLPLPGIKLQLFGYPAHSPVTSPNKLSWL